MTIDNISPPGSWQREIELQPWKYSQQAKIDETLAAIRKAGLALEANLLALEITKLKNELEALRGNRR